MKDSEIFDKSADLLEKHGTVAGQYGGYDRGFCALGVIYRILYNSKVSDDGPRDVRHEEDLAAIMVPLLDIQPQDDNHNHGWGMGTSPSGRLAAWFNNLVDAGKSDEAIAGFRKAAELSRAAGN